MVHRTATADDKKLQSSLKKLAVNNIAGIEEVNIVFIALAHSEPSRIKKWAVLVGEHDQR